MQINTKQLRLISLLCNAQQYLSKGFNLTQSTCEQVHNHKHQGFMGLLRGLVIPLGAVSQRQRSKLCSHTLQDQREEATRCTLQQRRGNEHVLPFFPGAAHRSSLFLQCPLLVKASSSTAGSSAPVPLREIPAEESK